MTKKELEIKLREKGIEYSEYATKKELEELLSAKPMTLLQSFVYRGARIDKSISMKALRRIIKSNPELSKYVA